MFEGVPIVDDNEGLPDEEGVTADVVDLTEVRAEAEAEGDGVEDPDFTAQELENALEEAQREAA
jgi:hypothetical protein